MIQSTEELARELAEKLDDSIRLDYDDFYIEEKAMANIIKALDSARKQGMMEAANIVMEDYDPAFFIVEKLAPPMTRLENEMTKSIEEWCKLILDKRHECLSLEHEKQFFADEQYMTFILQALNATRKQGMMDASIIAEKRKHYHMSNPDFGRDTEAHIILFANQIGMRTSYIIQRQICAAADKI